MAAGDVMQRPDPRPDNDNPDQKPAGPRTPYPVERPGITDRPGSEPDYFPGTPPGENLPKL
jgi:hypothetical protein